MAARTRGWAQTIAQTTVGGAADGVLQASTDTTIVPNATTGTVATDRSDALTFLVAGVAQNIRWGGKDGFSAAGTVWGAGLATNTAVWTLTVRDDSTGTIIATVDTTTVAGAGGDSVDRTKSYTPPTTGTYRLVVTLVVTVTANGAAVANGNTDEGNFGSTAPAYLTGKSNKSFTPGLTAVGSTLSSITQTGGNGSGVYATYGKTITNTITMGVGSVSADSSYTFSVALKQSTTTFHTENVPATTSATKTGAGTLVTNAATNGWPNKTAFSVNEEITIATSSLATSLGGAAIPWTFFSGALPAGWSQVAGNAIGATDISASSLFTADNTLTHQGYMQLNITTVNTPPDGVTDLTHNVSFKTTADVGEITHRVKDANGNGVNGIAYTAGSIIIRDVNNLTAGDVRAGNNLATTTLNGAAGWVTASSGLGGANPNFLGWPDVNPSGNWNYTWTISTANAVGLDNPTSIQYSIQAQNPNIDIAFLLNGTTALTGGLRHLQPGDSLLAVATATNNSTKLRVTPDSGTIWMTHFRVVENLSYSRVGTTVTVTQANHNLTTGDLPKVLVATDAGLNGTQTVTGTAAGTWTFTTSSTGASSGTLTMGVLENLISDTDNTFAAWKPWGPTQQFVSFALTPDAADPTQLSKLFSNTAGWGNFPVVKRVIIVIGGVNYPNYGYRELLGTANPHSGYSLDPILLALGGKIGTR